MPTDTGIYTPSDVKRFRYHPVYEIICDFLAEFFTQEEPVIDLGSGPGLYSRAMAKRGFHCIAIDGSQAAADAGLFPIQVHDLSKPCQLPKGQVLCLEVGEHIPRKFESVFLDNVFRCAQHRIVLSWAIVGQSGTGHVNCRDNYWVIERCRAAGWRVDVDATERARGIKFGPKWWFRQSILCFREQQAKA
ncbi:MAG: class I SAM-dependent methyltransferase [Pigmentiphaga sp.]